MRDRSSGALKSAVTYLKDKLTGNSKVQAEVAEAKLDNAINDVNLENKNTAQTDGERYALKGVRADGIEVYETSDKIKKMSNAKRKKLYVDLMSSDYVGRTARFVRNGHTYYAEFDRKN